MGLSFDSINGLLELDELKIKCMHEVLRLMPAKDKVKQKISNSVFFSQSMIKIIILI